MNLPGRYLWTITSVSYFDYSRDTYLIKIYSVYGELLYKFNQTVFRPPRYISKEIRASDYTGLNLDYYSPSPSYHFIDYPTTTLPEYSIVFNQETFGKSLAISSSSTLENSSTYGFNLGSYVSSSSKSVNYTFRTGIERTFNYQNGYVISGDVTQIGYKGIEGVKDSVETVYYDKSYLKVYKKNDTRIPTNCCILYLCDPIKYKKA